MKLIQKFLERENVRLILVHPPYTETQQITIDSICMNTQKIIGQVERKKPMVKAAQEIERLIVSHSEPFVSEKDLQIVILGKVVPKN